MRCLSKAASLIISRDTAGTSTFLIVMILLEISGQSNLFITHGGTGAIVGALKTGKKVIAVPRLSKYGEHVDDHQVQILQQFDEMKLILPCYEIDQLADKIKTIQNMQFNTYKSNTDTIIRILSNLIDGNLSSSL